MSSAMASHGCCWRFAYVVFRELKALFSVPLDVVLSILQENTIICQEIKFRR